MTPPMDSCKASPPYLSALHLLSPVEGVVTLASGTSTTTTSLCGLLAQQSEGRGGAQEIL